MTISTISLSWCEFTASKYTSKCWFRCQDHAEVLLTFRQHTLSHLSVNVSSFHRNATNENADYRCKQSLVSARLYEEEIRGKCVGFVRPICTTPCLGVHLTDGHHDLNHNQVIQWEEELLIADGHAICTLPHHPWHRQFSSCFEESTAPKGYKTRQQAAGKKKEKITHKCCKEAVHFSCAICFFINTAALSAVNTLWITLFLFARQCSETASGACLQSNRLFFLFLCFVSFLSDCRQGWRMSATSSRTEVCHVLMLVCSGTCENCHFSFQSQHLKSLKTCRREQKKKIISDQSIQKSLQNIISKRNKRNYKVDAGACYYSLKTGIAKWEWKEEIMLFLFS